jgi:hypothetical protein
MACGCSKNRAAAQAARRSEKTMDSNDTRPQQAGVSQAADGPAVSVIVPEAQRRAAVRSGGAEYENTIGCRQCYSKHLSKAVVEASEYFEEQGRESEFALCIGDIACAEDHALALGLVEERRRLREIRDMMWAGDSGAVAALISMASAAVSKALSE